MAARSAHTTAPRKAAGVDVRLRWWAVALPALAFAALLMLLTGTEADAAVREEPVAELIEHLRLAWLD